ncbi:VapE domain-containing protein [Corynebacterium haemomassiliense]|uniref:VapE domain-containing protein n=1 Tax=Corynebacterium haemomassiliense TaxID=2754726 RepID=UPI0028892AC4|nr:VapE domain-containing protein [Corynebacterium haemomassiliense]
MSTTYDDFTQEEQREFAGLEAYSAVDAAAEEAAARPQLQVVANADTPQDGEDSAAKLTAALDAMFRKDEDKRIKLREETRYTYDGRTVYGLPLDGEHTFAIREAKVEGDLADEPEEDRRTRWDCLEVVAPGGHSIAQMCDDLHAMLDYRSDLTPAHKREYQHRVAGYWRRKAMVAHETIRKEQAKQKAAEVKKAAELAGEDAPKRGRPPKPKPHHTDLDWVMENDPDLHAIATNAHGALRMWRHIPSWRMDTDNNQMLADDDMLKVERIFDQYYGGEAGAVGEKTVEKTFHGYAADRKVNLFLEWLEALPEWDGVERLERPVGDACDDTPATRAIFRYFGLSMIHRQYKPGCEVHSGVFLTGAQSAGKTSFFKCKLPPNLRGLLFSEPGDIPREKDDKIQVAASAIACFDEVGFLRDRRRREASLRYFTSPNDSYRPPYAKGQQTIPRARVECGTTNDPQFLLSDAGLRRFLPVKITRPIPGHMVNPEEWNECSEFNMQFWAEALYYYRQGERPAYGREFEALMEEHRKSFTYDPVVDALEEFLNNPYPEYGSAEWERLSRVGGLEDAQDRPIDLTCVVPDTFMNFCGEFNVPKNQKPGVTQPIQRWLEHGGYYEEVRGGVHVEATTARVPVGMGRSRGGKKQVRKWYQLKPEYYFLAYSPEGKKAKRPGLVVRDDEFNELYQDIYEAKLQVFNGHVGNAEAWALYEAAEEWRKRRDYEERSQPVDLKARRHALDGIPPSVIPAQTNNTPRGDESPERSA